MLLNFHASIIEIVPWKCTPTIFIQELQCIKKNKSCNALKKTNEWAQLTSEFFDALQLMNKNQLSTSHGMMFLFHTCWDFPSWQTHFRDWKQMTVKIYHSSRDTNDRTSMWKFQYVQYEIKWWFWRHTCTCSCKLWPLRVTIIYIHLHAISPNSITPETLPSWE